MYTIEVTYQTGDSEGSYEEKEEVGLAWSDKLLARKALNSLKEQHKFYLDSCKAISYNEIKEIENVIITKDWCFKAHNDEKYARDHWKYKFSCLMDDGTYRTISSSWIGNFENLIKAEIIEFGDTEDRYVP